MRLTHSLVALSLVALTAGTAGAQACLGIASFSTGSIRADAGLSTGDDVTNIALGLSAGAPAGPFGSVTYQRITIEAEGAEDESLNGFGVSGGFELDLSRGATTRTTRLSLCPVASFTRASKSFSEEGVSADLSFQTISAGLSLGTQIQGSPTLTLVPFGTLSFVRPSVKVESDFGDFDESDEGGQIDLGVGLVFSRVFTVRPMLMIPIGFEDSSTRFGVSAHLNFGSGR
jgi:hypothetical protein